MINKEELIKILDEGKTITLIGIKGHEWQTEYWEKKEGYVNPYECSYDGESSENFSKEDLEFAFCPGEAEEIEIR